MPELPEVETVASRLREGREGSPRLVGRTIEKADVLWHKTVAEPSPHVFKQRIQGQRIEHIGRRAKFIQFDLDKDTMLLHLRMSGDVLVGEGAKPLADHVRLTLHFTDGIRMDFNNPRKFGRVYLLGDPAVMFDALGPEPLDDSLTPGRFYEMLQARKRQLKPLLLDQTFIAGLGNIYVDEALNMAKLHPLSVANTVNRRQAGALLKAIRDVLADAIQRNGASIDWVYRGGEFQNQFRVYQRTDKPCMRCGTPVARIVVGQRGTHYCPRCQVLES
jgi:formamidopyrimidine-DNA glycosylase